MGGMAECSVQMTTCKVAPRANPWLAVGSSVPSGALSQMHILAAGTEARMMEQEAGQHSVSLILVGPERNPGHLNPVMAMGRLICCWTGLCIRDF